MNNNCVDILCLRPGDTVVTRQPNGWFGAMRVLQIHEGSYQVAITPYFDAQKPVSDDLMLRQLLMLNRARYNNKPCVFWVDGAPGKTAEVVASISLDGDAALRHISTYAGSWSDGQFIDPYYEWLWIHDRRKFEELVSRRQQAQIEKPNKHVGPMEDSVFWDAIGLIASPADKPDQDMLEPLVGFLSRQSEEQIKSFDEALAQKLYALDGKAFASYAGFTEDGDDSSLSPDDFLYVRCGVVAAGRAHYEEVLQCPACLSTDTVFEPLLYAAGKAYHKRTGKVYNYVTRVSWETFSNEGAW